ncbi:hypothetical protein JTB14_020040 [Gonioctena quinquepunctata]|nr:hypothetical protein JTB14_020040 [Gonioctena quinquepunctata]
MVQCDECQTVTKKLKRKRLLTKNKTFENFQKVTEDDWAIGVIPKMEVQNRNIWEAPQDHDVALPCNSNFKNVIKQPSTSSVGRTASRNKASGKHIARSIHYPITGDEGERVEVEDETLFQAMEKIKSHMVRQKKTALALPELDGIGEIMFTRILEYIFADSEVQITMYGLERNSKQPPKVEYYGTHQKCSLVFYVRDPFCKSSNNEAYMDEYKDRMTNPESSFALGFEYHWGEIHQNLQRILFDMKMKTEL